LVIEYFILIVYQSQISPESMSKRSWVKTETMPASLKSLDRLSLPEEGLTLADIVSGARLRLDTIVSEVLNLLVCYISSSLLNFFFFVLFKVIIRNKRAYDWSQLYTTDLNLKKNNHSIPEHPEHPELVQLMSEFDRVDITVADSNIAKIFKMNIDWNLAFNTVKAIMKTSARDFYENNRRHLLVYNARYMDYMIHLCIESDNNIRGWMVSRENRVDKTKFEGAEREKMASLAKNFYYHMWRVAAGK
jgi:hypothetical protein